MQERRGTSNAVQEGRLASPGARTTTELTQQLEEQASRAHRQEAQARSTHAHVAQARTEARRLPLRAHAALLLLHTFDFILYTTLVAAACTRRVAAALTGRPWAVTAELQWPLAERP